MKLLYVFAVQQFGMTHGEYFSVNDVSTLWFIAIALSILLYPLMRAFAKFKHGNKHITILKYL